METDGTRDASTLESAVEANGAPASAAVALIEAAEALLREKVDLDAQLGFDNAAVM